MYSMWVKYVGEFSKIQKFAFATRDICLID